VIEAAQFILAWAGSINRKHSFRNSRGKTYQKLLSFDIKVFLIPTGRRCQRERNQCHPNPCKNHGRCQIEGDHGFTCQCKTGFLGRLCEQNMNEQKDSNARRYRKRFVMF